MNEPVGNTGKSSGAKWALGCGLGCLTLFVLTTIAGVVGYQFLKGKVDAMVVEMKQLGFERTVSGQMLDVRENISQPTLYLGQSVKILGNCSTNLAIIAQVGEVHGRIDGKLYFRGQILIIEPNAEVRNGLDVRTQVIQKLGKVDGGITGTYQTLQK